jgi:trehalose-6-phosphate hydrolase
MEDLEDLIREAKKRGISLMFDMVFNHTSTEHEWFQRALQGEEKYKKYYIFRKGKLAAGAAGDAGAGDAGRSEASIEGQLPPTNWQSKFGGPAWQYVPELDEWYLHLFDPTQADLDWTNPDVRRECAGIVNFWREKGLKGFRFDVVNLISKATVDEDDPNLFDGRQFYTDGPRVHEYLQELNRNSFGQDPDAVTVGEMSSTTLNNCVKYAGKDAHELSMVFTFHHLKVDYKNQKKWELQPFDFLELKRLIFGWQTGMQDADAWNALFFNNHDQPRALSRFGNDKEYRKESAKMLAAVTHLMRGTPYVYMGEELGMTNAYFRDISQYRDVESTNIYDILLKEGKPKEEILHILQERSRDNSRTPMQWDSSPNAGFTTGTPWLGVNENYREINAEQALADPDSVFYFYQKLIRLRKESPVVQEGKFIPMLEAHPQVFAFERKLEGEGGAAGQGSAAGQGGGSLLVFCNFYGTETECEPGVSLAEYRKILGNYQEIGGNEAPAGAVDGGAKLKLKPYEVVVLEK